MTLVVLAEPPTAKQDGPQAPSDEGHGHHGCGGDGGDDGVHGSLPVYSAESTPLLNDSAVLLARSTVGPPAETGIASDSW
jgi:hypothetical protein